MHTYLLGPTNLEYTKDSSKHNFLCFMQPIVKGSLQPDDAPPMLPHQGFAWQDREWSLEDLKVYDLVSAPIYAVDVNFEHNIGYGRTLQ